ncbi:MAG: hypothetical protein AB7T19_17860 [Planctomycetota bacterium]
MAKRICRGEVPEHVHNEHFTVGAFDLLLIKARGAEAFSMLQDLCRRYPDLVSIEDDRRGIFMILTLLARQSETTQIPDGLIDIVADNSDLSAELRSWYRVPG